jgi:hypothetical protein
MMDPFLTTGTDEETLVFTQKTKSSSIPNRVNSRPCSHPTAHCMALVPLVVVRITLFPDTKSRVDSLEGIEKNTPHSSEAGKDNHLVH